MNVRQLIFVTRRADHFGAHGLFLRRDLEMGALPETGEISCIELYHHPGGSGCGPMADVKRRYWDSSGHVTLELPDLHIDPQGPLLEHFQRRPIPLGLRPSWPWYTDRDPDPLPLMLASGWSGEHGA